MRLAAIVQIDFIPLRADYFPCARSVQDRKFQRQCRDGLPLAQFSDKGENRFMPSVTGRSTSPRRGTAQNSQSLASIPRRDRIILSFLQIGRFQNRDFIN